jgi:hypothetical protein
VRTPARDSHPRVQKAVHGVGHLDARERERGDARERERRDARE